MKKIVVASNNAHKIKEIKQIMADTDYEIVSMKDMGIDIEIEENGTSFYENALIKAKAIKDKCNEIVMADDSGLVVDYLNGEPGIYSARYMGENTSYDIKNSAIIKLLENAKDDERNARFVASIVCVFPNGKVIDSQATMEGVIAKEIKGNQGFGYDPILYIPEKKKTSAELSDEEKNQISHRGKALKLIKEKLLKEVI